MHASGENPYSPERDAQATVSERDVRSITISDPDSQASSPSPTSFLEWWRSDWGPGPLLTLALPLIMSTGFMSIMLFTDRTLLYYWDKDSAPAAMGAGSLYWTLMTMPAGMLGYLSAFVAQYMGAGRPERVVVAYRHALRLAWMAVPFLILAFIFAWVPFRYFGHAETLQRLETTYLRTLVVGGIAVLFYSVQSGLMTGLGYTRWVLLVDFISTIVNLVLSWILIFGLGIIPGMGVFGAGLATCIAFWLKLPVAQYLINSRPELRRASRSEQPTPWEPGMMKRLITYGAPSGLQMLSEAAAFTIIMLQVGRLGGAQMTATTLALNLNVLAFVPMIGLGIGVGVLVGRHVLERRVDLAQRTVTCALWTSIIYTGACAIILGFFSEYVTQVYTVGSHERFDDIKPLLMPLLQIIAFYCIFDGFQIVFVGAIKGAGDTWFVLIGTAILGFGSVGVGFLFETFYGSSLLLWWYVIAGWVGGMATVFGVRYLQGKWKRMQVIEHVVPEII